MRAIHIISLSLALTACTGAAADRATEQPTSQHPQITADRASPVSAAVHYDRIHKEAHASKHSTFRLPS